MITATISCVPIFMIDGQHAQKVQAPRGPTFASNFSTYFNFSATCKSYFSTSFNFWATFASWNGQLFNFFQLFCNLQKLLLATYRRPESNLQACGGVLQLTVLTFWQLTKATFQWSQATFALISTFRQLATVTFQLCPTFLQLLQVGTINFSTVLNFSATCKSYFWQFTGG